MGENGKGTKINQILKFLKKQFAHQKTQQGNETEDTTGIEKNHEKGNEIGIVKKDQDFWNTATQNIRGLTGKENELIGEFEGETLGVLGIRRGKERIGRNGSKRRSLLVYKGVNGNSRAKEGVGCIVNKKHERFCKWIDETERIVRVELKMKENVTVVVTYGSNDDEIVCDEDDFGKNQTEIEDAKVN